MFVAVFVTLTIAVQLHDAQLHPQGYQFQYPGLQFAGYATVNMPASSYGGYSGYGGYGGYSGYMQPSMMNQQYMNGFQGGHPAMQQSFANPYSAYFQGNAYNPMLTHNYVHQGLAHDFRDQFGTFDSRGVIANSVAPNPVVEQASYLSLVNDKENFQTSGCAWDLVQLRCTDTFGLCKGGCRDFAVSPSSSIHDCRCIPYGYAALLKLAG